MMALPTLLPSGAVHPDLLNNAAFVKYVSPPENPNAGQYGKKLHGMSDEALQEKAQSFAQAIRGGEDVIDLSLYAKTYQCHQWEDTTGKTVIDNRSPKFIVETIQPGITTSSDAESAAAKGAPTHGFLYQTTDFLLDAAREYSTLGENEVFKYRHINDVNFVRDTLDFFTDGNYTQEDEYALQDQMTAIVYELAGQIKNGEEPDLNSVQTTLTVGGADVTLSQLIEMQKVGRELSESFSGLTSGSLGPVNTEQFAEMGLAKSVGNCYGNGKGEIGKMFSDAIDRLYEKGVAQVKKTMETSSRWSYGRTSATKDAEKVELDIADMFSELDTSSKSNLTQSFSSTLSQMRALVQLYCDQYNFQTSHVGLASATDAITKQFRTWTELL